MKTRNTIFRYAKDNVLLIPESLHGMADARLLLSAGQAGVFYKKIDADLLDVEFYTNLSCLVYIVSGMEVFTDSAHREYTVRQGDMIFLPQNEYFISDFTRQNSALRAFLFFLGRDIIEKFVSETHSSQQKEMLSAGPHILKTDTGIHEYIKALKPVYGHMNTASYLTEIKLMELLLLLDAVDTESTLRSMLYAAPAFNSKRNIKHLMKTYAFSELTLDDFAHLSGRSRSTFNREFKRLYGVSPHQWLMHAKLEQGKRLVQENTHNITEIAYMLGYSSASHFISAYKKKFGVTPKQKRSLVQ